MRIKTSELTGPALRWATAKAVGLEPIIAPPEYGVSSRVEVIAYGRRIAYRPECDWAQGGELIEREQIEIKWNGVDGKAFFWKAWHQDFAAPSLGDTPLIAACRAIVAAKLGEHVDVPDELCE